MSKDYQNTTCTVSEPCAVWSWCTAYAHCCWLNADTGLQPLNGERNNSHALQLEQLPASSLKSIQASGKCYNSNLGLHTTSHPNRQPSHYHASKASKEDICTALYNVCVVRPIYKALRLAVWHVLTRYHTVLCATHVYPHMEWAYCLYSPAAQHHHTLAGTHFPSH